MSKTLAIIGAGHLGLQIAHIAISDRHFTNVVFFDDVKSSGTVGDFSILGATDKLEQEYHNNSFNEVIVGIGYKHIEKRSFFYDKYSSVLPFATIIHSTCWIDSTAVIKPGCILYPKSCIDAHVLINHNVLINLSCTVSHDSVIGPHCFISPGVVISGFVTIGEKSILGVQTTVIDNISITPGVKTGGGTVIINNIEKAGLYVGNPARLIRDSII